jgi:hypothetical protein
MKEKEDIPHVRETKRTIRVPVHIGNGRFDTVSLPKILPESGLFRLVQEYISNSYTPEWVYVPIKRIKLSFEKDER